MLPTGKMQCMVLPQTVTNAGTVSGYIDTRGFDFAVIDLVAETVDATNLPTVLRLGQSDTTPTAFTDTTVITNFVGGTATSTSVGFVIPTPVTTTSVGVNTYSVQFRVDLRARQRFLAVEFSPLYTHTAVVIASLFRGDESPDTATKAGVLAVVAG